jgi:predicted nucleic acid-binding protein
VTFVLDASVTLAWCLTDEATDYTERVLDLLRNTDCIVPPIWPMEVANVLVVSERRRRLTPDETAMFARTLQQLPIRVDATPIDLQGLMRLAREQSLSAYDASYLELAIQNGLSLATQDQHLLRAATNVGRLLEA